MVQNPKYWRAKECDKTPLGNINTFLVNCVWFWSLAHSFTPIFGILYHVTSSCKGVIFHSTNERSHWIKGNINNPNLNNSILLNNANLNNSILLKSVSYCYLYCLLSNGIFRCWSSSSILSTSYPGSSLSRGILAAFYLATCCPNIRTV